MKSRPALSFLLSFFILFFLFFIVFVVYQQRKYNKQVKWITECNTHPKISEIRFDEFSFDEKYKVVYTDSIKMISVMESLCGAQSKYISSREGNLESCKMHIAFQHETVTLNLHKDNHPFTSIDYAPEGTPILSIKTDGFNFLFDRR
jgi:hypothetical protein